jgi:hypothetical protein
MHGTTYSTPIKIYLNETHRKDRVCKYLPRVIIPLWPMFFSSTLECVITMVQENQERLEMNGIYQLLVYANDVNSLDENINAIEKNTETLHALEASMETDLQITQKKLNKCSYLVIITSPNLLSPLRVS